MGGTVPLGYSNIDKKLLINQPEAEQIRKLFQLYLQHGTARKVYKVAAGLGIRGKLRRDTKTEKPLTLGGIYHILQNPIYRGMVRHNGKVFEGAHNAIIDQETWDRAQRLLAENRKKRRTGKLDPPSSSYGLAIR